MRLWVYNAEIFSDGSSNLWKPVGFVAKQNSDFCFFWDTLMRSFWSGALQILQMWPILLAHRTMHLAQCTLYLINSWLVVGSSCFQTQWPLKLVHPLERHCPFLPKAITILYRSPIFNLAFAFIFINCTSVQGVVTLEARPPTQEALLSHYCNWFVKFVLTLCQTKPSWSLTEISKFAEAFALN